MKVFISWSGHRSHTVAVALHKWLKRVIQALDPFLSSADIESGAKWHLSLGDELEKCDFGVIVLTPENKNKPWIIYEAGAISKTQQIAKVVPYLVGLRRADLSGPLAHFQAVDATEDGTLKLLQSINLSLGVKKQTILDEEMLRETFQRWWSDLETELKEAQNLKIEDENSDSLPRNPDEMLSELVELSRNMSQSIEQISLRNITERVMNRQYMAQIEIALARLNSSTSVDTFAAIKEIRRSEQYRQDTIDKINDLLQVVKDGQLNMRLIEILERFENFTQTSEDIEFIAKHFELS